VIIGSEEGGNNLSISSQEGVSLKGIGARSAKRNWVERKGAREFLEVNTTGFKGIW